MLVTPGRIGDRNAIRNLCWIPEFNKLTYLPSALFCRAFDPDLIHDSLSDSVFTNLFLVHDLSTNDAFHEAIFGFSTLQFVLETLVAQSMTGVTQIFTRKIVSEVHEKCHCTKGKPIFLVWPFRLARRSVWVCPFWENRKPFSKASIKFGVNCFFSVFNFLEFGDLILKFLKVGKQQIKTIIYRFPAKIWLIIILSSKHIDKMRKSEIKRFLAKGSNIIGKF